MKSAVASDQSELQEKGNMVNTIRIAKGSDTKNNEKIFIALGDLEAIIRTIL